MILAHLTSPGVDNLPRDILVIIPVASIEQHSIHLPVFTDTAILTEVIRRIEKRLPNDILTLPVMWLGYSQHHMKYPGTLSATSDTHLKIMYETLASMIDHGFKRFLLINSHGGNEPNISVLRQHVMEQHADINLYTTTPYAGPSDKKMNALREDGLRRRQNIPGTRIYKRFDQNTNHGGLGDPRPSTPKMGEQLFQIAEDFLVGVITQIKNSAPK
jgi:creatinine amidohydrolase/Fe(II)-dependent formamide hydrolase-like protein